MSVMHSFKGTVASDCPRSFVTAVAPQEMFASTVWPSERATVSNEAHEQMRRSLFAVIREGGGGGVFLIALNDERRGETNLYEYNAEHFFLSKLRTSLSHYSLGSLLRFHATEERIGVCSSSSSIFRFLVCSSPLSAPCPPGCCRARVWSVRALLCVL